MADRPVRGDRRMTDAEALMWTVDKDPALRTAFLQVSLLDSAPDVDRLRRRMLRATRAIPRLRQRVVSPPAGVTPPEWADDPSFDIDFHVRRTAVPPPGTLRQLLDMAAVHYQDAFDRARPLWTMTVVEGLEGGGAALLTKMHHTSTDGVGGMRLSMEFVDLAPDAPEPAAVVEDGPPSPSRGLVAMVGGAAAHTVRRQLGIVRRAALGTAATVLRPHRFPARAAEAAETARSVLRQLAVVEPARSPLWAGRRSLARRFEVLSVSLEDVKRAARGLGGTVNDLFVSAVAGGAGAYHRARGAPVEELRMAMAVNLRTDRSVGGNAVSPTRVLVPTTADPRQRFEAVRERLAVTKGERVIGLFDGLATVAATLPTAVLVRVARMQAETMDFATSNLRGAPTDLFVAGARITGNHPMGPTGGTAFNATVMSYRDGFDVGLNVDTAAVDDAPLLRECVLEAFRELIALGRAEEG